MMISNTASTNKTNSNFARRFPPSKFPLKPISRYPYIARKTNKGDTDTFKLEINNTLMPMKRKAVIVSTAAVSGALAVILNLARGLATFPFPVLTYLKIELAEIPIVTAYLISGPAASVAAALIYWLALNAFGEFVPLGPAMKLAAVTSTLAGIHAARKALPNTRHRLAADLACAAALRTLTMTLINYLIMTWLLPEWLSYAEQLLKAAGLTGAAPPLAIITVLTAVYNTLHAAISLGLSYTITKSIASLYSTKS